MILLPHFILKTSFILSLVYLRKKKCQLVQDILKKNALL